MEEEKNVKVVEVKKKKKGKGLIKFLIFLLVLGGIVLSLGYIFPGLLWVKNLGVNYSSSDYNSIMEKLNYIKDTAPTGDNEDDYTYKYGELTEVNVEFTSEELTAFFNENRPSYYALKNVQIKINDDGSIEAVATANVDYFLNEVLDGEYSKEEINSHIPALGILPDNVNLYIKMSGSVTNNKSNISIDKVSVQGVTIPSVYINSNAAVNTINIAGDSIMSKYNEKTGSSFDSITISNNKINFKGSIPSSLERIEK